ncbi:MAG TPA: V-type ATPase subunit [Thermoplasmata archaeon]|nr:V-type ATPase subunit [Thermoplasmata archaeon]
MAGSPYASSLGRLQSQFTSFLQKDAYPPLANAKDVAEVTKILEATPYGPEILQMAASYKGAPLLEMAINRTLVRRNRQALDSAPFAGKALIGSYLRRWDIQNIGIVLSAKAQGRALQEAESQLVSSRDIPAGMFAGTMTLDDFRLLLQQPSLEASVQALVRFGYGATLLPLLDTYERTKDIFPLLQALDRDYYIGLLESSKYFQGDEWVIRQFLRSELDVRNLLLLLKGKDAELPFEIVSSRFLEGGDLSRSAAEDLYSARTVPELATALEGRFPTVAQGASAYADNRSLTGYEIAVSHDRAVRELKRLRSYPLSICVIFTYLLLAELERTDLRRIIYGRLYGVAPATLEALLVVPRL